MSYLRRYGDEVLASLNNFTSHGIEVEIPADAGGLEILLSNCGRGGKVEGTVFLGPWECLTAVSPSLQ